MRRMTASACWGVVTAAAEASERALLTATALGRGRGGGGRVAGRVNRPNGGSEDRVGSGLLAELQVCFERARVAGEVGWIVELSWVDEDADDDRWAALGSGVTECRGVLDEGGV